MNSRNGLIGLVLVFAVVFGMVWFLAVDLYQADQKNKADVSQRDSDSRVTDTSEQNLERSNRPPSEEQTEPDESDTGEIQKMWFQDSDLDPYTGRFPKSPPLPIRWDSGCGEHPFADVGDLGELVKEQLHVDAESFVQRGLLVKDFSVFYSSQEGRFHQFGLQWEMNEPPTYSLESYISRDPLLEVDVERMDVPGFPQRFRNKLSEMHTWSDSYLVSLQRNTFEAGARIVRYRAPAVTLGEKPQHYDVTLFNQFPLQVHHEGLHCQLSLAQKIAFCTCPMVGRGSQP